MERGTTYLGRLIGVVTVACGAAGCSDGPVTRVNEPTGPAVSSMMAAPLDVGPLAITLPVNDSITSASTAFRILQKGTGRSGIFEISNSASTAEALRAVTNGSGNAFSAQGALGRAAFFTSTSGTETVGINGNSATGVALRVTAFGPGGISGQAARFTHGASSLAGGVQIQQTAGAGASLRIDQAGTGKALHVVVSNTTSPAEAVSVANNGTAEGIRVSQNGTGGRAGYFSISTTGNGSSAFLSQTFGSGFAGEFLGSSATSRGVLITTQGGAGLQVVGGSKNAVVGTSSGARALYTEESSEVWFSDYGQARLTDGRVRIAFDPTFAETVALQEPYHVFLQSYGDADLMVRNRTGRGFDVVRRGGGEDAEFSYRIVAKRRGFESKRLERAPWADSSTGSPRF